MSTFRVLASNSIALCAASTLLFSCAQTPPVLRATPVAPPPVPATPATPEAGTLGWTRAHQLLRTAERVTGESPAAAAAAMGVDLTTIDAERPFVILFGAPQGPGKEGVPGLAYLPVKADSSLAMMAAAVSSGGALPMEGGISMALNGTAPAGSGDRSLLQTLAGAPLGPDFELFVQVGAVVQHWRTEIDAFVAQILSVMEAAQVQNAPMGKAVADAYGGWLKGVFDSAGSVLIGFSAGEADLSLSVVSREKAVMAASFPGEAMSLPDLGQFVAPAPIRLEWKLQEASEIMQMSMRMYDTLLASQPAARDRLRKAMEIWTGSDVQMAMGMAFDAEQLFTGTGLALSDKAEALYGAMLDIARLFEDPAVAGTMMQGTGTMALKLEENVREIEGFAVARTTYQITVSPEAKNQPGGEMLERLAKKGITIEIVQLGAYVAYTFNQPPAVLDALVKGLLEGKGAHPSLASRSREPAGGWMYVDVDVSATLRGFTGFVPPQFAGRVPKLDPALQSVTLFGYGPPKMSWYHMTVPVALVRALQNAGREVAAAAAK